MMWKSETLSSGFRHLLAFAFPWKCALCGNREDDPLTHGDTVRAAGTYCQQCVDRMTPEIKNSCQHCAAEVGPHVRTDDGCIHCRDRSYKFRSVICVGMYAQVLRDAILSAKWSYSAIGIESLAELLVDQRSEELAQLGCDLIVPIPQSWQARVSRRFNGAERIANALARRLKISLEPHILCRSRRTRPQKRVPVQRRFENQRGSFRIQNTHVVKGARVLIVDDVLTTGATCNEAARMLKSAGAKEVHVAIIARVLDHTA